MKAINRVVYVCLALVAANNLLRGGVHVIAPDGGAASAAGLDLSAGGEAIIALLSAIGAMQMAIGACELLVLACRRDLAAPILGLQAAVSVAAVLSLQLWKPLGASPAIMAANLGLTGVAVVGFVLAARSASAQRSR